MPDMPIMTPQHARQIQTMTYPEYLAAEETAEVKHEYWQGEVWAMSGGTIEHGGLAAAIGGELRQALAAAEKPCRVYSSDVRVRVVKTDVSMYPDVSVVCGPVVRAADDSEAITNPILVVEVLSPSSEAYDRGVKFEQYWRLPSLQAYVLVSQIKPLVEVYRRTVTGWAVQEARAGEQVTIPGLDVTLDVDDVYANPLG
jgi:Uma2 family endonuclease